MFKSFKSLAPVVRSPVAMQSVADDIDPSASWQLLQLGVGVPGGGHLVTVNAHIAPGRLTAILGPNGAGKSSLLNTLTGQWPKQGGQLLLDGKPLGNWPAAALAQRRAMMMQDGAVAFDFSVQEVVELGRYAHRLAPSSDEAGIVAAAMATTEVTHLAHRSVQTLSGGERARTHLARVLAQIWHGPANGLPRWLLLDEPTAAMDLAHQHRTMALLREWAAAQGVGVITVVHDLNLALRYADDVLIVHQGGALCGPVHEVLTPQSIAHIWGVGCFAAQAPDGTQQYLFSGS
ncbi:MAG: heme ABC transporter ATP-binding protein [Comamonas sp.]